MVERNLKVNEIDIGIAEQAIKYLNETRERLSQLIDEKGKN